MVTKLALPAGDLRSPVSAALNSTGLKVNGYGEGSRTYILKVGELEGAVARVFREKDIPIQVAVGNYDLGVCGLDWVEELLVKYPSSALVKVRNL